jgi:hypothetical protein
MAALTIVDMSVNNPPFQWEKMLPQTWKNSVILAEWNNINPNVTTKYIPTILRTYGIWGHPLALTSILLFLKN